MLLAEHAIPVFPCAVGGKQPLTTHGFHDATNNTAVVDAWWRRTPTANIGMPTGSASGVDVVDIDVHTNGDGFRPFHAAWEAGLLHGWAWIARTPSGGAHVYYLHDDEHPQRSWQVPSKHIDFRSDGGYIVVAPSQVVRPDGNTLAYKLLTVGQHQPRPLDGAVLRSFLEPPRPQRPPTDLPPNGVRPDALASWMANRPEGGRNRALFWATCRMAEEGHSFHATSSVLADAARQAGLGDDETRATIRSAFRIATRCGPPLGDGTSQALTL